jgi:uncharacterized protein YndB with AHSA1/START domain
MQQLADACTAVTVTHQYAASPARVFDAWLSPQLAGSWLFATASRPMVRVDIDARAGGAFCFVERRAGAIIEHRGHYDEITRPQRLVFVLYSPDCAPKEVPLGGAPGLHAATDAKTTEARLLAGFSLARAGLHDDAKAQFEWIMKNASDSEQIAIARRELGF